MKIDEIQPAHCYARARRVLAELELIREELGRSTDGRPVPEINDAAPREVYFQAIAAWHKAERLAHENGTRCGHAAPAAPHLADLKPGHVLQLIDAVHAQVVEVAQHLGISEKAHEPALEPTRTPADVLGALIRVNRTLSAVLERPFTPSDVHRVVTLARAYAERMGARGEQLPLERKRRPVDCYQRLEACLAVAGAALVKRGQSALRARTPASEIAPTDVYDLAQLVLGEVAFLHALTSDAQPLHAFEPGGHGHWLPSHVHQQARTLEMQLSSLR
jgi:hypothetical protein